MNASLSCVCIYNSLISITQCIHHLFHSIAYFIYFLFLIKQFYIDIWIRPFRLKVTFNYILVDGLAPSSGNTRIDSNSDTEHIFLRSTSLKSTRCSCGAPVSYVDAKKLEYTFQGGTWIVNRASPMHQTPQNVLHTLSN